MSPSNDEEQPKMAETVEMVACDSTLATATATAAPTPSSPLTIRKERSTVIDDDGTSSGSDGDQGAYGVNNNDTTEESLSLCQRACNFYWKQEFLILVVLAIPLARLYPQVGADYLQPQYTATWLAVALIFFLSGLTLSVPELRQASVRNMPYNILVLMFNFMVVSGGVFGISRVLHYTLGWISLDLANGMVVCACLPVTVNMAIVLAEVAGADRAAAVFLTVLSNLSGVFISPLLIVWYLGVQNNVEVWTVFYKLALRVIVPMFVGQVVRCVVPTMAEWVVTYKAAFKRAQQYLLIFIIYTIFCRTLQGGSDNSVSSILLVVLFNLVLLLAFMGLAWYKLSVLYPNEPQLRVTGLFCCTHKTISIGVPLITAMYGSQHASIGLYTLPILIWHPMQLVIGTLLMPQLQTFIRTEQERLAASNNSPTGTSSNNTSIGTDAKGDGGIANDATEDSAGGTAMRADLTVVANQKDDNSLALEEGRIPGDQQP